MDDNKKYNNETDLFNDVDLPTDVAKKVDEAYKLSDIIFKLVQRRLNLNISQAELSLRTGISKATIARIEALKTIPRLDTVIKLSMALELSLELN